jgi:Tol biopolymer transport system component
MAVTPQAPPGSIDAEALFKEARRLRRRRWLTAAGNKPPAAAQVPRGQSPAVDANALRGHGDLAFVSGGRLWVLDGSTQALRQVRHGHGGVDPQFSPDGRWLAFAATSRIWVAGPDGAAPRPVPGSRTGLSLSWSPRGDLLTGAGVGIVEATRRGAVQLVTRQGSYGAWSPDGNRVAFIEAPASPAAGSPQPVVARWYATHTLRILRTPGAAVHEIPGSIGATAPVWSASATSLVDEAGDAVWLVPAPAARPVRTATPLYGEIGWAQQFAWSAR